MAANYGVGDKQVTGNYGAGDADVARPSDRRAQLLVQVTCACAWSCNRRLSSMGMDLADRMLDRMHA